VSLLELRGVSKRFRQGTTQITALDDVDFDVNPGEFVALVGRSGSGKSTLLHLAGGLDTPDEGTVKVAGRDLSSLSAGDRARLRRRSIGFVFQFFHLLPTLTVVENVALPLLLDGSRPDQTPMELLDRVGLSSRAHHLPGELSGGEMQRAAIARSLIAHPQLVLADEPTGNLDSSTGHDVLTLLVESVAARGAALIMVTHDSSAAARAERTLHLKDGRFVDDAGYG
jgi:ABC-type lipoprotein export system ATPase subunit